MAKPDTDRVIDSLEDFQQFLAKLDPRTFEDFVFDLIAASPQFTKLERNLRLTGALGQPREIDIVAIDDTASESRPRRTYFEVKKRAVVTVDLIETIAARFRDIFDGSGGAHVILVTSGSASATARNVADKVKVEIWDAVTLAKLTTQRLIEKYGSDGIMLQRAEVMAPSSKSAGMLASLRGTRPGRADWSSYQQLAAEIFEYLFCPPLGPLITNLADQDRRNIRDMVSENHTTEGYWSVIRASYSADYIVVDAKNYTQPFDKRPVIDIAHYLKPYGCGLFGILFTRKGASAAGKSAIREHWIASRKMIVAIDDNDVEEMLGVKATGGRPEEVLRRQIADFRMSL